MGTQADLPLVVVLDGQGGGLGRTIAERLCREELNARLVVVGANAVATANMMKSGVAAGATGENAWAYNCARARVIVGPIGIVIPNAMHGEISPKMAATALEGPASRVLVPVPNSHLRIVGLDIKPIARYLDEMVRAVREMLGEEAAQ